MAGTQQAARETLESLQGLRLSGGSSSFLDRSLLFGFVVCSLPLGLLGKDKKTSALKKKNTHSFLFPGAKCRVSVQSSEVVCGEQEEEQVSGTACCVRGWISTSSSDLFMFYRPPFLFLCGSRAGCPQGCSGTVAPCCQIPCAGSGCSSYMHLGRRCKCSLGSDGQGIKQHPGSGLSSCTGLGVPLLQTELVLLSIQLSLPSPPHLAPAAVLPLIPSPPMPLAPW